MKMTLEQIIVLCTALFTSVPLVTTLGILITKRLLKRFMRQSDQSNENLALKMLDLYKEKVNQLEKINARTNQELEKIHKKLVIMEGRINERYNKK